MAQPTEETVQAAKTLVSSEPDDERRGLLLSLLALLAARYFDRETIRKLFKQEMTMIRTNTFIDEWLEQAQQRGVKIGWQKGRQEGWQEGERKGERKGHQALLLRLLEHNFGAVPVQLTLRIQDLPADELQRLFNLAMDASSLNDIDRAIPVA